MNYSLPLNRVRLRGESISTSLMERPGFWIEAAVVAVALLVAVTVARAAIGTGDYGQWLMVSRYYSGESVPDYRQIEAVPPLLPLFVAGLKQILGDPLLTMTATKVLLAVGLFLSSYWAGSGIFGDKGAGLLGATATFFATDRTLELFAFGGLPQITSLTFIALAMGAFARAQQSPGLAMNYWIAGATAILFAAMSHAGTGSLAVLAGSAAAGVAALGNTHLSWRDRLVALTPMGLCLILLAPYWLFVILPQNHEYLVNSASLSYRGPWAFWRRLTAYDLNVVVAALGGLALVIGAWRELSSFKLGRFAVPLVWAGAVWGFFLLTVFSHVGTEYPRFQYPLLQPLALVLGGSALILARYSARWLVFDLAVSKAWAPIGVLVLLMVFIAPSTASSFGREASFYQFPDLGSLIESLQELDAEMAPETSIVSSVAVGKWFEGVTGRPAVFAMPNRYSFRPLERDRSLAADVILRSTFSASDGQFFLRYTALTNGVPTNQWITINHRGEYVDLMQLSPTSFEVVTGDEVVTTLADLTPERFENFSQDDVVYVETSSTGSPAGAALTVLQQSVMSKSSNTLSFSYQVTSDIPVDKLRVSLTSLLGRTPSSVTAVENGLELTFPEIAQAPPYLSITSADAGTTIFEDDEGAIRIVAEDATTLRFDVSFEPSAPDINEPGVFKPAELLDRFNIQAAVLIVNDAAERRLERLEALGFVATYRADGFIIAQRERVTSGESDSP